VSHGRYLMKSWPAALVRDFRKSEMSEIKWAKWMKENWSGGWKWIPLGISENITGSVWFLCGSCSFLRGKAPFRPTLLMNWFLSRRALFRTTGKRNSDRKKSEAVESLIEGEAKKTDVSGPFRFKTSFYEEFLVMLLSDRRFAWILIPFERFLFDLCPCN
jgi:hypothetical protein